MANWFTGETCKALLDGMTAIRESGRLPESQCYDLRYADHAACPECGSSIEPGSL